MMKEDMSDYSSPKDKNIDIKIAIDSLGQFWIKRKWSAGQVYCK